MTKILNLFRRILQLGVITFLYAIPWLYWGGNAGIVGGVFYTLGLTAFILWSELGEVFADGDYLWIFSFKLRSSPRKVIDTETGKKYYISMFRTLLNNYHFLVIYKNYFLFYLPVYQKYESTKPSDTKELRKDVKNLVNSYEKELEKKNKSYKKNLSNWDGLIGSDGSIKSYTRDKRLGKLLENGKKGQEEIQEEI